ncbi:phosphatase PAP2 family protein [Sulfobacillus harzensis]|uniref:Phosphatase PAP2 family protein n=1 Tax=Sulfobacillus harzensis TaxID=2729629 RepID=A0A7Y0L1B4_9FIRM|nr:phosphatase PAP2 family protein [Sulfobacillus harzensis]NMP21238.1 phosphatase PAP2 family protein [Sulfobacillus harzensis]
MTHQFPITGFDKHWELVVNGWSRYSPLLNHLAIVLAKYAPEIWAVIFLLLWFWPPLRENRARRAVVYAVVAGVLALVINVILGHIFPYRPRPFVYEPHLIHQLVSHKRDTSFPSDHAAGSFGFAVGLFFAGASDGILALILAAAVAIARVFVGLHWPTDVIVGAAVGVVAGLIVLALRGWLEWLVKLLFRIFGIRPEPRYRRRQW